MSTQTKINWPSIILLSIYGAILIWWIFIFSRGIVDSTENYLFGLILGVFAVLGGFIGIVFKSSKWGFINSKIGKAIILLSTGLVTWGIGTIIFAYYNLTLKINVYPSIADLIYLVGWPCWAISMVYLSGISGAKFKLKTLSGKLTLLSVPLLSFVISYFLLFVVARDGILDIVQGDYIKIFFDLSYLLGDVVILTFAFLCYSLSLNYLGGYFKTPIFIILFGFVLNYFADFVFVYQVTKGEFFVASWVDMIYVTAILTISLGVSLLDPDNVVAQS